MSSKRRDALDKLEFKWSKKRIEFVRRGSITVEHRYAAIEAFFKENGHVDIDASYGVESKFKKCMVAYRCAYCDERLVGDTARWQHHRNLHMAELTPEDRGMLGLGHWLRNAQRQARVGKLDDDVHSKLTQLGVALAAPRKPGRRSKITFDQRIEALESYSAIFGNVNVPRPFSGRGNCWECEKTIESDEDYVVVPQRTASFHARCFTCFRCESVITVDDGGLVWWGFGIDVLPRRRIRKKPRCNNKSCLSVFGTGKVKQLMVRKIEPSTPLRGSRGLGIWVHNIRAKYKAGKLDVGQVDALESAGMVWTMNGFSFESRVEALLEFKEENGHMFIPRSYTGQGAHRSLGRWASRQRSIALHPILDLRESDNQLIWRYLITNEQRRRLTEIDFPWNGVDKPDEIFGSKKKAKKKHKSRKSRKEEEFDVFENCLYWLEDLPNAFEKAALVKHNPDLMPVYKKYVESFRPKVEKYEEWPPEERFVSELKAVVEAAANWNNIVDKPVLSLFEEEEAFILSGMMPEPPDEEEEEEEDEEEEGEGDEGEEGEEGEEGTEGENQGKKAWELMLEAFPINDDYDVQ
jgi:hypothetical protein